MVWKHILIWRSCWAVRIGCLNFQSNGLPSNAQECLYIAMHHSPTHIELGYGELWSKNAFYSTLVLAFSKFKLSISSAQHILRVKMSLETKFYIFWKFFTIFLAFFKISVFQIFFLFLPWKILILKNAKKIVKKFQKI